jgi:hypothetical protein
MKGRNAPVKLWRIPQCSRSFGEAARRSAMLVPTTTTKIMVAIVDSKLAAMQKPRVKNSTFFYFQKVETLKLRLSLRVRGEVSF